MSGFELWFVISLQATLCQQSNLSRGCTSWVEKMVSTWHLHPLRQPKVYADTADPGVGKRIKIRLPILVTETLRMRYFFHVSADGITFEDETGTVLPDAGTARLHASVIAAELAQGGDEYQGFDVCAVDEDGNEIARMPVLVPS